MLLVRNVLAQLVAYYPDEFQEQVEAEIPAMSVVSTRLAMEVVDVETRNQTYAEAVSDPEFPLMGRVHFGVADTLLYRLPPGLIAGIEKLMEHAAAGDFDSLRQLTFAIATRRNDLEAALCRFLLWQAMRLNLLVATWTQPAYEARGLLRNTAVEAEALLRDYLQVPDMVAPDVRPLNVLVAAAFEHLEHSAVKLTEVLTRHSEAVQQMLDREEVVALARELDARSASVLWPGEFCHDVGSQGIADRFPHHFRSANAVEAQRTRTVQKLRDEGSPTPYRDRLIDVIRGLGSEAP